MTDLSLWSKLDLFRAGKEIEAARGHSIFTSFSYLDAARFADELGTELGIDITPYMLLDPEFLENVVSPLLDDEDDVPYQMPAVDADGSVSIRTVGNLVAEGDDTGYVSMVVWYKLNGPIGAGTFPVLFTDESYYNSFTGQTSPNPADGGALNNVMIATVYGPIASTEPDNFGPILSTSAHNILNWTDTTDWRCELIAMSTNHPAGEKPYLWYHNDVLRPNAGPDGEETTPSGDRYPAFTMEWSGKPLWLLNDSSGGAGFAGSVGAIMLWPGQFIDWSVEANRRKIITADKKPVDPAVAVTEFGLPTVYLNGPASTYATNLGTGGAVEIVGALTDATTSPSDA